MTFLVPNCPDVFLSAILYSISVLSCDSMGFNISNVFLRGVSIQDQLKDIGSQIMNE